MGLNEILGKEVNHLTFINRIHTLEGIIFELKEALRFYSYQDNHVKSQIFDREMVSAIDLDYGDIANKVLRKYNKTWCEIYQKADSKL